MQVTHRNARQTWASRNITSRDLFIAALLMIPAFLFNPSVSLRVIQFSLIWLYMILLGQKNSPPLMALTSLAIIFFNLLVPYGRVLATLGPIRITQGALLSGIEKAISLEGLIMVSKATIRPDLHFPGNFGKLFGQALCLFARILERNTQGTWMNPIKALDNLLLELSKEPEIKSPDGEETHTLKVSTKTARLFLLTGVLFIWSPLFFL